MKEQQLIKEAEEPEQQTAEFEKNHAQECDGSKTEEALLITEKNSKKRKSKMTGSSAADKPAYDIKSILTDLCIAISAGFIVGTAYFFFQNSNGFAPGGVGGLATITNHLLSQFHLEKYSFVLPSEFWGILMILFNLPIFILVSALINRKLGIMLSIYMIVQSIMPKLYELIGVQAYSAANNGDDFNIIFACIAAGVVSGFGFSTMLRHFGASGGTYGITALLRRAHPDYNMAYVSFIMDASVVAIAFFVYGMKVTPVICTLLNLFIANVIVDNGLNGIKNGYRFEIVTTEPELLAEELMTKLHRGVTEIRAVGMHSHTEKYMIVCIINKRQLGDMMRIIKAHPGTFASFARVNEVFGNFKRKV